MNLSTIALALVVWKLLSDNNAPQQKKSQSPLEELSQFVSDDAKNLIDCVGKLSSKESSAEDKTGAIFQMMSNPAVMNFAGSLFKKQEKSDGIINEEGYKFEQPSKDAQDFFKPIDNVADAEIKHKLYWFYDNWYVK